MPDVTRRSAAAVCAALGLCLLAACAPPVGRGGGIEAAPNDWPAYGRSAGEQHYSPLAAIDAANVSKLGLVWSADLPIGHSATQPIEADGVVYTSTGHSLISAFKATTGALLWRYDSKAAEMSGPKLRQGYGSRGLAYSDGRVFIATHDGRLMALDARDGKPVWTAQTVDPHNNAYITGAPRVFDGRVVIGFGGADGGGVRGYVTCYDAKTGKQLWRFYAVPGNPAVDHDETTRIAARTWRGEWWRKGGGGTAWNAITYDPELKRFYIGMGNGYPYNQKLRSPGGGDNLFLSSIVAVAADTGKYIWHYQVNPGEQWDYKSTQDITLATLPIQGRPTKVLMQAPTDGFFYVIDRTSGKLISAQPFVKTTWASRIDLATGRPVENPGARFNGPTPLFEMWPSILGGHSWLPQAFSPKTGLVYIPTIEKGMLIGDKGVDLSKETLPTHPTNINSGMGITGDFTPPLPGMGAFLTAWDPVGQKARWRVRVPGGWPGGAMATGGGLVFQGRIDHAFVAYAADTGRELWRFDARSPIVAPPISYKVDGVQYVTVITGNGGSGGGYHGVAQQPFGIDYATMPRRVLTFALDGHGALPPAPPPHALIAPPDPGFRPDPALETRGIVLYHAACGTCHGAAGQDAGTAPDLRTSLVPASAETFKAVVTEGVLVSQGMPKFDDMPDDQRDAIRQYLRSLARNIPPKG